MSYSFGMYFKQLNKEDNIVSILELISKRLYENRGEYIEENRSFIPSFKGLIMDESKKVIFTNQASKYNINKYKLLLIKVREPFSYLNYEYYDAICVSHSNGCVSYIDFGEERFMNTMDKTDFYTMLFDSGEGYFAGEDIEVRGIMNNSNLVKNIAKALEMMDSKR